MPIPVQCQECAAKFNLKNHLEGKTIRCPKCQARILVTSSALKKRPAGPRKDPAKAPTTDEENEKPARVKDPPRIAKEPAGHGFAVFLFHPVVSRFNTQKIIVGAAHFHGPQSGFVPAVTGSAGGLAYHFNFYGAVEGHGVG